jgi:hypothetical protein
MRLPAFALALACAALASSAALAPVSPPASVPSAVAEFSFREEPVNARGFKSLADLRGKPVVIDFWGKN